MASSVMNRSHPIIRWGLPAAAFVIAVGIWNDPAGTADMVSNAGAVGWDMGSRFVEFLQSFGDGDTAGTGVDSFNHTSTTLPE